MTSLEAGGAGLSLLVDILLVVQAAWIFLFGGYEWLTLRNFPTLPADNTSSPNLPSVSIIVPARDQAATIFDCIRSLVGLNYHRKEIIVVEGHSTDQTRDILEHFEGQIRIVREEPLPPGWVGKNWACHLGYMQARGVLLLFTDGDSVHHPDSLTRTVRHLNATGADLLTLAPGAILRTLWEKVLQPPIFLFILLFVGGKWVNYDNRPNALGNGQYMLFRREAYEKTGGHKAVKDRITEDYHLARLVKMAGLRLRIVLAKDAVGVRMYSGFREIWRGWRKNFYTVSEKGKLPRALLRLLLLFSFLVPFFVFGYGLLLALVQPFNIYLLTGGFASVLLWMGMIRTDQTVEINPLYGLLFPVAILIFMGIGLDSTVRGVLGLGFPWKGRVYGKKLEMELEAKIA